MWLGVKLIDFIYFSGFEFFIILLGEVFIRLGFGLVKFIVSRFLVFLVRKIRNNKL